MYLTHPKEIEEVGLSGPLIPSPPPPAKKKKKRKANKNGYCACGNIYTFWVESPTLSLSVFASTQNSPSADAS